MLFLAYKKMIFLSISNGPLNKILIEKSVTHSETKVLCEYMIQMMSLIKYLKIFLQSKLESVEFLKGFSL